MNENQIREEIVAICRRMHESGWGMTNGNVSVKLDDGRILVTPSRVPKQSVTAQQLAEYPSPACSSEVLLHLRCYAERPDVRAVVHAHPPYATAFAVAGKAIDSSQLVEMSLTIGDVPVAPFAAQGTEAVGDSVAGLLASHDVILLANHGAVAVGEGLSAAFANMDSLELCAKTILLSKLL
jgi:L-fuculose-phosphate aldolase